MTPKVKIFLAADEIARTTNPKIPWNEVDAILDRVTESVGIQDQSGRFIYANQAGAEILGFDSPAELLAASRDPAFFMRFTISHLDGRPVAKEELPGRRVLSGDPSPPELTIKWISNGKTSPRWITLKASPVYNATGDVVYAVVIVNDVTATFRAQEELRASNSVLEATLQGISDCVYFKDLDLKYVKVNKATAEVFGKPIEEIIGKSDFEVNPPIFAALVSESDRTTLQSGGASTFEEELPIGNHTRHFLTTKTVYRDASGKPAGVIGISRDITEQKKAEHTAHFLAEASRVLSSSLDYRVTLSSLAWLTVPSLADSRTIDLIDSDDRLRKLVIAHDNPVLLDAAWQLELRFPRGDSENYPSRIVAKTGRPLLLSRIDSTKIKEVASSPEHLRLMEALPMTSAIIVPLVVRGRTLGTLSLTIGDGSREYQQDDLALVEELGRRAAVAVDVARSYEEAETRWKASEAIQKRLLIQNRVLTILTSKMDPAMAVSRILEVLGSSLDFQLGLYWSLHPEKNTLYLAQSWNANPDDHSQLLEYSRKIEISMQQGVTGKAWSTRSPRLSANICQEPHFFRVLEASADRLKAAIFLPVTSNDRSLGVLEFFSRSSRLPDQEYVNFLISMASHIGNAIAGGIQGALALPALQHEQEQPVPVRPGLTPSAAQKLNGLSIDPVTFTACCGELKSRPLTSKEFQILNLLRQANQHSLSRGELVRGIWGNLKVSANSLDVHLFNLRRKIHPLDLEILFRSPNIYTLRLREDSLAEAKS